MPIGGSAMAKVETKHDELLAGLQKSETMLMLIAFVVGVVSWNFVTHEQFREWATGVGAILVFMTWLAARWLAAHVDHRKALIKAISEDAKEEGRRDAEAKAKIDLAAEKARLDGALLTERLRAETAEEEAATRYTERLRLRCPRHRIAVPPRATEEPVRAPA